MKKFLFLFPILSCITLASEANLYLRAGLDFNENFSEVKGEGVSLNESSSSKQPWELSLEATKNLYDNFEIGLGVAYQRHTSPDSVIRYTSEGTIGSLTAGYNSVPVYTLAKYNFDIGSPLKPFIKATLGYSFNEIDGNFRISSSQNGIQKIYYGNSKVNNGLFYGIGGGLEYNDFTIDLMYQVNKTDLEHNYNGQKIKNDFDYSRVTLSFGYKFQF